MKDKHIAILYEVIKIDNNLEYLKPIEILKGFICKDSNFYSPKHRKKILYGENTNNSKYIYALPQPISSLIEKYDFDDIVTIMNDIMDEEKQYIRIRTMDSINNRYIIYNIDRLMEYAVESAMSIDYSSEYPDEEYETVQIREIIEKQDKTVEEIKSLNVEQLYKTLTNSIIGQDEQIKKIVTAIGKNCFFSSSNLKTNIFICGPTGVGKTEIFRQLSKEIDIPLAIIDITPYTVSGYVGNNIENILKNLYENANCNLEKAQHGIVILDEIDKKTKSNYSSEVSNEGVLNSLLKIIEGTVVQFKSNCGSTINFDTSLVTFVSMGAFSEMDKILKERKSIGFSSNLNCKDYNNIVSEDLVKYGIPKEFVGRFNLILKMNNLTDQDLYKIITSSAISPLLVLTKNLKEKGINITYDDNLIDYIIKESKSYNSGARGLKNVIDELSGNIMYDILKGENKDFVLTTPNDKIKVLKK